MIREKNGYKTNAGFSLVGVTAAIFLLGSVVLASQAANIREFFRVRSAAATFVDQLQKAQGMSIGHDVDRRIRITSERGYVRERRMGAGWLFEEAYTLPEGLEISGPETIEFASRSALSPVALYTMNGPHAIQREIVLTKTGVISIR